MVSLCRCVDLGTKCCDNNLCALMVGIHGSYWYSLREKICLFFVGEKQGEWSGVMSRKDDLRCNAKFRISVRLSHCGVWSEILNYGHLHVENDKDEKPAICASSNKKK